MKLAKLGILSCLLNISSAYLISRVAIVTGGTRGIGYGISNSLAKKGYNLLLTYNTNENKAKNSKIILEKKYNISVVLVNGDLSLKKTRDAIFNKYDDYYGTFYYELSAIISNAGQYIGITSDNCENIGASKPLLLGEGLKSDFDENKFNTLRYYQKLYGEAYIDLCERGLNRMNNKGSIIGISSPGCTQMYNPQQGYDGPGSGKTIMEYSMRLIALEAAKKNINCNVIVPGAVKTEAWDKLKKISGNDAYERVTKMQPLGPLIPDNIGEVVAFLCSKKGKYITGLSIPVDGGLHLKT